MAACCGVGYFGDAVGGVAVDGILRYVNNVMREDVVTNGDGSKATLANAPEANEYGFIVPKTVE